MPYVFQMLSLLLEQRLVTANGAAGDVGGPYVGLVGCLLAPPLWDKPANVRPLVRLLCALTAAAHPQLQRDNRLVSAPYYLQSWWCASGKLVKGIFF